MAISPQESMNSISVWSLTCIHSISDIILHIILFMLADGPWKRQLDIFLKDMTVFFPPHLLKFNLSLSKVLTFSSDPSSVFLSETLPTYTLAC